MKSVDSAILNQYLYRCRITKCSHTELGRKNPNQILLRRNTGLRGILSDVRAGREPCCADFILELLTSISGFLREKVGAHAVGDVFDALLVCRMRPIPSSSAL